MLRPTWVRGRVVNLQNHSPDTTHLSTEFTNSFCPTPYPDEIGFPQAHRYLVSELRRNPKLAGFGFKQMRIRRPAAFDAQDNCRLGPGAPIVLRKRQRNFLAMPARRCRGQIAVPAAEWVIRRAFRINAVPRQRQQCAGGKSSPPARCWRRCRTVESRATINLCPMSMPTRTGRGWYVSTSTTDRQKARPPSAPAPRHGVRSPR